ncbi:MAG: hypothetical protein HPY81_11415 [Firmicutes bacterium]|nr:hypothetical protein [Bacillota bacterium]
MDYPKNYSTITVVAKAQAENPNNWLPIRLAEMGTIATSSNTLTKLAEDLRQEVNNFRM